MKHCLMLLLCALLSLPALARDFSFTYKGKRINYTVVDENAKTCKTAQGNSVNGELIIPEVAKDGESEYSVIEIGYYSFHCCFYLTAVTIPNSVTTIGKDAFSFCTSLTSLTIPGSVNRIERWAFSNCTNLTSVTIPSSVTKIGKCAFSSCTSLTSIEIPNSVTAIDERAFNKCSSLTSVTIPNSVTEIGMGAFAECQSLTTIAVDSENQMYSSVDGVLFNKDFTCLVAYPGGRSGTYSIPESITSIGKYAFCGCSGLTSVNIPSSVNIIDYFAFQKCSSLTSITIPNSVTAIGDSAFSDCSGLTSVSIPNSVKTIGGYAFYSCSSLTSIAIPSTATLIGTGAFAECLSLITIDVESENPMYSSADGILFNKDFTCLVEYPGGRNGAFTIPGSVTSIGDGAFFGCSGLTSVTIPGSVTTIGNMAFYFCTGLTSLTIPSSVTTIGDLAFHCDSGCSRLTEIYYEAVNPISASSNIFSNDTYEQAVLYVPAVAVEKCKSIDPWKNFKKIEPYEPAGLEEVTCGIDHMAPMEVYSIRGMRVASSVAELPAGIYVVRQNGKAKKIAVQKQ